MLMFGLGTPKEVRETLAAIKVAEDHFSKNPATWIASADFWNGIGQLARQKKHTLDAIKGQGWSAEELAWQIIANVAWEELLSGRHHTYRGVLGMRGQAMLPIFMEAARRLNQFGRLSDEKMNSEIAHLNAEIKEIG